METEVSIGQVKRDISQLVNRVAFGGERIVLTSRGRPKAVIISLSDYAHIQQSESTEQLTQWEIWKAKHKALTQRILAERDGQPFDLDTILELTRADLEERHDDLFNS